MVERWRLRTAPLVLLLALVAGCAPPATAPAAPVPVAAPAGMPPAAAPVAPAPSGQPPGAQPPGAQPPGAQASAAPLPAAVRLLQLNLCSSGIAACYTGRSTAEAAALLRAETPDLVTLNEVCGDDVEVLERALAEAVPGAEVTSAFQPARDATTGEPYRCRNGEQYGNGLLSRWAATAEGGIHPAQDPADPEQRSWLCLDVASPAVSACTTHLAYTRRDVAVAQCRFLFDEVVAPRRERTPVVVGGDLNLGPADGPDLVSCFPAGSTAVDDGGGPQVVVAAPGLAVAASGTIDLRGATDHPGLLVTLGVSPG
jgi:hypothetical protein